jgi:NAD(P)-dependent dehydrogenase (short-subunit alcohol dehydrogenase family)
MDGLQGKVMLIAGGTGTIGTATAQRLAMEGASVVVGSRTDATAAEVVEKIRAEGGEARPVHLDITDDSSVRAAVRQAVDAYGGLDGVHVNAANMDREVITGDSDAVDIDLDVFDRTVAVNLRGHVLCTRHAIPEILKRGGGAIVYTSSSAAFVGEPERLAYAATKSGVHALVRHVASRWGKEGIRANAVAPGPILTDDVEKQMPTEFKDMMLAAVRSARLGRPEDIAAFVTFLMSSEGEWINGQTISVDGGMTLR